MASFHADNGAQITSDGVLIVESLPSLLVQATRPFAAGAAAEEGSVTSYYSLPRAIDTGAKMYGNRADLYGSGSLPALPGAFLGELDSPPTSFGESKPGSLERGNLVPIDECCGVEGEEGCEEGAAEEAAGGWKGGAATGLVGLCGKLGACAIIGGGADALCGCFRKEDARGGAWCETEARAPLPPPATAARAPPCSPTGSAMGAPGGVPGFAACVHDSLLRVVASKA
jgi:hypothetical protein